MVRHYASHPGWVGRLRQSLAENSGTVARTPPRSRALACSPDSSRFFVPLPRPGGSHKPVIKRALWTRDGPLPLQRELLERLLDCSIDRRLQVLRHEVIRRRSGPEGFLCGRVHHRQVQAVLLVSAATFPERRAEIPLHVVAQVLLVDANLHGDARPIAHFQHPVRRLCKAQLLHLFFDGRLNHRVQCRILFKAGGCQTPARPPVICGVSARRGFRPALCSDLLPEGKGCRSHQGQRARQYENLHGSLKLAGECTRWGCASPSSPTPTASTETS